MAKTMGSYTIMAKMEIECDLEIKAENLEDALVKGRELKELDFIDLKGQFLDGNLHIQGVFES